GCARGAMGGTTAASCDSAGAWAGAAAGASPSWRSTGAGIPISRSHACCSAFSTGFSMSGASSSIVAQHLAHDASVFPTPAGCGVIVLAYGHLFESVPAIKRQRIGIGRPDLEEDGRQTFFTGLFLAMPDQRRANAFPLRFRRHRNDQEMVDIGREKRHAEAHHTALPMRHPCAIAGLEPIGKIADGPGEILYR